MEALVRKLKHPWSTDDEIGHDDLSDQSVSKCTAVTTDEQNEQARDLRMTRSTSHPRAPVLMILNT